jgi:lipopolysaccharide/colanic/teichoic acid biosynthesis glycosyltransferase
VEHQYRQSLPQDRRKTEDNSGGYINISLPDAKEPFLKRPFDFSLALLGIVLSLPLWLTVSLAIYLEDRNPVFFLQERCGKGGKTFKAIKFRTMKVPKKDEGHHKVIYVEQDSRVTKVGRILRETALDELPELINILKGDMSFVGPRPLPYRIEDEESNRYKTIDEVPGYQLRSHVRPGLTGIAQVYAPKDIDRRNKFRYDNLYVKNQCFWLDLKLLCLSLWVTFRGRWERRGKKV